MIALPKTLADIESLIRDQVSEDIHLDYKASPALSPNNRDEIAKDVSAFANSDGGILIYGVEEDKIKHLPLRVDTGVESKWNREWLERLITSNITPRIEGVEIEQISVSQGRLVVCVKVPKKFGPHQASDKRYYKRFNFSSFPMEHYEVEDLRARRNTLPPLVTLNLESPGEIHYGFELRNVGDFPARDLIFDWSKDMKWPGGLPPSQFVNGIKFLPPGKVHRILNHGASKVFDWKDKTSYPKFDINVSYTHGESGQRLTEAFHFDIADYPSTHLFSSDIERIERPIVEIRDCIRDLTRAIEKLSR